jgi:hypothetical protein
MSRKGTCWDNACSETLFGPMKVERLHGMEFHNLREAKDATLEWLLWYSGSSHGPCRTHDQSHATTRQTSNVARCRPSAPQKAHTAFLDSSTPPRTEIISISQCCIGQLSSHGVFGK